MKHIVDALEALGVEVTALEHSASHAAGRLAQVEDTQESHTELLKEILTLVRDMHRDLPEVQSSIGNLARRITKLEAS